MYVVRQFVSFWYLCILQINGASEKDTEVLGAMDFINGKLHEMIGDCVHWLSDYEVFPDSSTQDSFYGRYELKRKNLNSNTNGILQRALFC